jgi:hypothetical protein
MELLRVPVEDPTGNIVRVRFQEFLTNFYAFHLQKLQENGKDISQYEELVQQR